MVRIVGGSYAAWVATLLLWVPSVIAVFLYFGWTTEEYPSYNTNIYGSRLDPAYLKKLWDYRRSTFSYLLAIDFFVCMGLLFALYSIMCVKKIFKHSSGMAKNLMVYAFIIATILPIFEFLRDMGAYEEAYNLSEEVRDHNTNQTVMDANYSALEISFRMTQAQSVWIFSSIYLAVGLSLLCASYLFWRKTDFPSKGHAYLGVAIATIGFLSFAFEIASFFNETLLLIFGITTLLWGVVAFPLWLVWLGVRLHREGRTEVISGHTTSSRQTHPTPEEELDIEMDSSLRM